MIQGDSLLSVGRVGPSVRPSSLFVCLRACMYRSRYVRVCVCVPSSIRIYRSTTDRPTKPAPRFVGCRSRLDGSLNRSSCFILQPAQTDKFSSEPLTTVHCHLGVDARRSTKDHRQRARKRAQGARPTNGVRVHGADRKCRVSCKCSSSSFSSWLWLLRPDAMISPQRARRQKSA